MLPKLLIIITFIFGVNKITAQPQNNTIKNVNNNSVIEENPLTFRYDYRITGKNNSYDERSEYGNENESKGNYFVQLPEGNTKYEVHYTANNWGFHPVVRLSSKNNHSEVTSHFIQNKNSLESLNLNKYNNNKNKSDEIYIQQNTLPIKQNYIQYDESLASVDEQNPEDKDTSISLNKIISNMFSKGIVNFLSTKSIATPINSDDDDEIPSESLDDIIDNSKIINSSDNFINLNNLLNVSTVTNNITTITEKPIIIDNNNNYQDTTRKSLNIFLTNIKDSTRLPFIISPLPTASIILPINNSSQIEESKKLIKNENNENFVSDDDVLEINDAAEEYENINKKDTIYVVQPSTGPVINNLKWIKDQIISFVYPQNDTNSFDLPIIVNDENINNVSEKSNYHEDNLIAEESQKTHISRYLLPQIPSPKRTFVKIIPTREQFINIQKPKSEKQFNVQILEETIKQLPLISSSSTPKYINDKRIFTPNTNHYELDSDHEDAEKNFSIEDYYKYTTTEAQSRKFLKHFNLKLSPSGMIKSRIYTTTKPTTISVHPIKPTISTLRYSVTLPTPTKINGNLKITTSISKKLLQPPSSSNMRNSYGNKNIVNFDTTSPIPLKKNRGKTFVEIQKSINVHNLLIKEDKNGKFIEQHEEYLKQPYQKRFFKDLKELQSSQYFQPTPKIINNNYLHQSTVTPVTLQKTYTIPFSETNDYFNINSKSSTENIFQSVEKIVEIPSVEKFGHVEKEKPIEKFIDRPIYVTNKIEKSYPVETVTQKLVSYPVEEIVEKNGNRPYSAERPYPVNVEKSIPIENVDQYLPYPVGKYFNRPEPYPIEVKQYIPEQYRVEEIVEKTTDRPIEEEKIIEQPSEPEKLLDKFIDHNITIEKITDRPSEFEKIVEKITDPPVPIQYPVHLPIHIPYQNIPLQFAGPNFNRNNQYYEQNKLKSNMQLFSDYQFPYLGSNSGNTIDLSRDIFTLVQPTPPHINAVNFYNRPPQNQHLLSTFHGQSINRPFYKYPGRYISDYHVSLPSTLSSSVTSPLSSESQNIPIKYAQNFDYKTIYPIQNNDYFGPVPLQNDYSQWQKYYSNLDSDSLVSGSVLHKRSSDFGRNLRVEYGFKPPLIPSIETDDQGVPIEKKRLK